MVKVNIIVLILLLVAFTAVMIFYFQWQSDIQENCPQDKLQCKERFGIKECYCKEKSNENSKIILNSIDP